MLSIQRVLFLFSAFLFASLSQAQDQATSPYSYYGLGDDYDKTFTRFRGMADTKIALSGPFSLNPANPASYGELFSPVFDVGMFAHTTTTTAPGSSQTNSGGNIQYFSMGFPINEKKNMGMAFGIVPISKVGYAISATATDSIFGDVELRDEGDGGINQFFLGFGRQFSIDTNYTYFDSYTTLKNGAKEPNKSKQIVHRMSLGANLQYNFGTVDRSNLIIPPLDSGAYASAVYQRTRISAPNFDVGMQYQRRTIKYDSSTFQAAKIRNLQLGATYQMGLTQSYEYENLAYTFRGSLSDTIRIPLREISNGEFTWPQQMRLGVGYQLYNMNSKRYWQLAADVNYITWSEFSTSLQEQNLNDVFQVSVGAEMIPEFYFSYQGTQTNYWRNVRYRMGARYKQDKLYINGNNVNEFGMTFGLGLPLSKSNSQKQTSTVLNMGVEYGERGQNKEGLIKEQFVRFTVGISLTPSKYDNWFYKRKID